MNEVEKMYKTIFGEFAPNCSLCAKLVDCEIINNTHNCNKFECNYKRLFDVQKRYKLLEWMLEKWVEVKLTHFLDSGYYITTFNNLSYVSKNFEDAIASFINNLWQDLTEEERTQIKEILSE